MVVVLLRVGVGADKRKIDGQTRRMGFWADWKARRTFKKAHYRYRVEHSQWQQDIDIFKKIKRAFELAEKGEDAVSNLTVQKSGEVVLWIGQGQFHEAGKTAGHYEGTSQGISMPLFGGLRYRVGAMRGTFVPGDVIQAYKEVGEVVLTTTRLLFNGSFNTKEWAFAKWTGAATSDNESDYVFHVSNRQKTSGILFSTSNGREFNRFLAQAINGAEDGIKTVVPGITQVLKDLAEDEPKEPVFAL